MTISPYASKKTFLFTSILATSACFSSLASAETENNLDLQVAAEAGYIDNFLYQAKNEQSTGFYKVSSVMALTSKSKQSAFELDATIASYAFQDFENDDHSDFSLMPTYQFKFAQNQRLHLSAHWLNSYNYRGTGLSLGDASSLTEGDEREDKGAKVGFEYGNEDSQGRLNFEVAYSEGEFTTRRAQTRQLDSETLNIKSSFDYLLSGKTYLAFDVDYRMTDFEYAAQSNRDALTGLVGVKWQTTVISELNFLIGYQNLKFENNTLADDDAFKWRFDYTWRPSDFTTMHVVSNRKFDESNRLTNSYRLAEVYQVDINHEFTEEFNVFAAFGLNRDQFITPESKRDEDYFSSTIMLNYQRTDRLNFHLRYQYKSLDANYGDLDYSYNSLTLGMAVKL